MPGRLMVFAGSGSPLLTARICGVLGIEPAAGEVLTFSDGNTFVRVLENVRGADTYVVQSIVHRTNDYLVELLFWVDALKRASAGSVTAVIPYFGYGKGDKKDEPRVSIRARVCADALEAAGCDRVVTMDLHAPQIQGFFRIPVDNLYGHPTLCARIRELTPEGCVVVAPDTGFADEARMYADYLGTTVAIGDKQRTSHDESAEIMDIIGDVRGRDAVIVDDFVVSGGTLAEAAKLLLRKGARRVFAAVTHGVLAMAARDRIDRSPITRLLVTDTVEGHPAPLPAKLEVVTVAPCFGEAIGRINRQDSVSAMFPGQAAHR